MNRFNKFTGLLVVVLGLCLAGQAQTITTNISSTRGLSRMVWEFTTGTNGAADGAFYAGGSLQRFGFYASSTNSPPTAAWDVTAKDEEFYDVFHGLGANLASNAAVHFYAATNGLPLLIDGLVTIAVTNAGSQTKGKVILYVR